MDSYKIKVLEGICLVVTILLTHVLLSVPSALITQTASSTLLNIVYVAIITLIFFFIIYKLFSLFPGNNIIDISGFLGGKVFKFIYGFIYIIYILGMSAIIIRLFSEGISLISLSHINVTFIILTFVVAVGITNYFGLKSISRLNIFILPIMILSIIFLYFASTGEYTFERIFPILGYGAKETFVDGISNIFAYSGIYVLFFLFPLLTRVSDFKKIGISSILIYTVLLLLSVSALLFSIPQVAETSSPLSLYILARQINLGEYIQNIDAFFLLIWIPFLFEYLSINMHFALSTFKQLTNTKYSKGMIYCFCAIIFVLSLLSNNMAEINMLNNSFYKYTSIVFVFIIGIIILVSASIKKLIQNLTKRGTQNNA